MENGTHFVSNSTLGREAVAVTIFSDSLQLRIDQLCLYCDEAICMCVCCVCVCMYMFLSNGGSVPTRRKPLGPACTGTQQGDESPTPSTFAKKGG